MIDWEQIDTVLLDMDGTLLDLRFDNYFWLEFVPQRYAQQNAISLEAARDMLFPRMRELRGQLDWYCTSFWSRELDLPIIELKHEIADMIQVREHVESFLAYLRRLNKEIILFTNAHEDTLALKMEKTGLAPSFDRAITSHSLGHAKETSQAWDELVRQHAFEAGRTLFIDDSFAVLDSAREHGVAQLLGIARPDSQGARLQHDHYALLDSFTEIMQQ